MRINSVPAFGMALHEISTGHGTKAKVSFIRTVDSGSVGRATQEDIKLALETNRRRRSGEQVGHLVHLPQAGFKAGVARFVADVFSANATWGRKAFSTKAVIAQASSRATQAAPKAQKRPVQTQPTPSATAT